MANILYRTTSSAPAPVSTSVKNAPLTWVEGDANVKALNDDIQTRQLAITNITVTGTSQACAVNSAYFLTNAAATACTAPTGVANYDKFTVTPVNGLLTNTIDFGSAIVKGIAPGMDITGVLTLNPAISMTFMYLTTISKWVVL